MTQFSDLKGKTLTACVRELYQNGSAIRFEDTDGKTYRLYHIQQCCESVDIESINGDLADLVGHPLLMADESDGSDGTTDWTFYRLATVKGYVDIRWTGKQNYYSTSVSFVEVP